MEVKMNTIGTLPANMCAISVIRKFEVISRVCTLEFVKSYWITMRPYLLFVSGITGIAGLSFVPALSLPVAILLFAMFFFAYGFGQALTDCFQMDTDALSSPYRPLSRGIVKREDVLRVSLAGLILSGIIVGICAPINIPLAGGAVLGLATYTYFKRRWWGGPWYNAWIVTLLCIIAYVAAMRGWNPGVLLNQPFLATLGVVSFGYANFVLSGYYKDVSADRATGYNTLPVRFGFRISNLVSDVFALGATASCCMALYLILTDGERLLTAVPSVVFAVAGIYAVILAQIRLHKVTQEDESHKAIVPVVHAYVLLLSSIAAAMKPGWTFALIVFYAAFVWTMRSRPVTEQI
jgi:4-hydroxybenzoate polyprenyltransferase